MSLLETVALLEKIPASFWGVLAGGGITLLTVFLTNRASDRRLRRQFDHERNIKNTDREMALRKEIYLAAAEAIVEAVNSLTRMSDLRIPNDKVAERYMEKTPALGKIHVIATEATAGAFIAFATAYAGAYLRLLAQRNPLLRKAQELTWLATSIEEDGKERDRWLEHMKQFNLEGAQDRRRWDVIAGNFEFNKKKIDDDIARRNKEQEELVFKQVQLSQDCLAEVHALSAAMLPVIVEVRQELELPISVEGYKKIMSDGQEVQKKAFQEFLQAIKSAN